MAGFHCSLVRWLWFLWVGGGGFGCVDGGGWMRVLILVGLMVVMVVGWVGFGLVAVGRVGFGLMAVGWLSGGGNGL